jgi:hypothetical protein
METPLRHTGFRRIISAIARMPASPAAHTLHLVSRSHAPSHQVLHLHATISTPQSPRSGKSMSTLTNPCLNSSPKSGISVAAGIPDFRTPGTGLYDNLQKYNLPEVRNFPRPSNLLRDAISPLLPSLTSASFCHSLAPCAPRPQEPSRIKWSSAVSTFSE